MSHVKQILSLVREGDFAHPGEIEAIEQTLRPIPKQANQLILDVGCGLGGTAHYVQEQGWGRVTGLDLDQGLIHYAKEHYPELFFIQGDILQTVFPPSFELIYCFSSFFCFADQEKALQQLAQAAAKDGHLVLFDYSRFADQAIESPFFWSSTALRFYPIYLPELKKLLAKTGWIYKESSNITSSFVQWYTDLMNRFEQHQAQIIKQFGQSAFNQMYQGYQQLLKELKVGRVGGIIVYAQRA